MDFFLTEPLAGRYFSVNIENVAERKKKEG